MFLHLCVVLFTGGLSVQGGLSVWWVSVQWGLCPGGLCPWEGFCPGGRSVSRGESVSRFSVRETPLYGKEWVVRMLLECFLVFLILVPVLDHSLSEVFQSTDRTRLATHTSK